MRSTGMGRLLAVALLVNGVGLVLLATALVVRDGVRWPSLLPMAVAQQPPIAGGAGVFVMPAQLSGNTWGVYLLDVDAQTLAVYQYLPGERQLQLVAARTYRHDRRLQQFNTAAPSPREVEELLRMEERLRRGAGPETPAPSPAGATGQP